MNTEIVLKKLFPSLLHAYISKQEYSALVEIRSKKRNSIKDVATLIRGALER